MPRRIAILGASGSVGSSLAVHLLRSRLLEPADTLLLVGHGVLKTERKLLSTRIDLMDAFYDDRICIEIVPDVCEVEADIVICGGGRFPISRTVGDAPRSRRDQSRGLRAYSRSMRQQTCACLVHRRK